MIELSLTEAQVKEVKAGIAARRRELDKAFKACMKADAQAAAEKVHERLQTLDGISEVIKEKLED